MAKAKGTKWKAAAAPEENAPGRRAREDLWPTVSVEVAQRGRGPAPTGDDRLGSLEHGRGRGADVLIHQDLALGRAQQQVEVAVPVKVGQRRRSIAIEALGDADGEVLGDAEGPVLGRRVGEALGLGEGLVLEIGYI